ncbi:MAG TPA: FAD-dependent monooxygenase [Arachnia sp.]|jgi:2-polyprenyl-6-methoxyphenol hydroxylase-like FAD-dependent oxidoreductase|nr:FAD-dependent monooxygenase [Arachnia sp.]
MSGTAVVVGGGIAGLTAAVALGRIGWRVTVLEEAPVFWEAGAGLSVMRGGQRALGELGLLDRAREEGHPNRLGGVRRPDGAWLAEFPDGSWTAIGLHRRSLHGMLLDLAGGVAELLPGARVQRVVGGRPGGESAEVWWHADGVEHVVLADLVVGADGVRSITRDVVAPGAGASAMGYVAWRAVAQADLLGADDWAVWWGQGVEFAAQRIAPGRVSWHCLLSDGRGATRGDLAEAVSGWEGRVRGTLDATADLAVFRHDLREVRPLPSSLSAGRTVLIGDAAHALAPTLNQGANLALEDGVTLGGVLAGGASLPEALRRFDELRLCRCRRIATRSRWMLGLGAGWKGPGPARDLLVRLGGRWLPSATAVG